MKVDLEHDYSPMAFEDVVGLTYYKDFRDRLGRITPRLTIKPKVEDWCRETLGYCPLLKVYKRRLRANGPVTVKVWLRFANETDRTLFRIKYAEHFMPAALAFIPFAD
jgi:hypothetical protein